MNTELRRSHRVVIIFAICLAILIILTMAASRIVLPKALSNQLSQMLEVPVRIDQAGINPLKASFWMRGLEVENLPGAGERLFLSLEKIDVNLSFTSLLARQLIFQNITFEKPVLYLEYGQDDTFNTTYLRKNIQKHFRPKIRLGAQYFFTGYEIHKFQIKHGVLRFVRWTPLKTRRKFTLHKLDFSFSNFAYPPHRVDPVPTSFYFGAKIEGIQESNVRVLGRGNFLSEVPDFNIRSDFKNIMLRELNSFTSHFPFLATDGFADITSVMTPNPEDPGQFVLENDVTLRNVVLIEKPSQSKIKTFANMPKQDVIKLFERLDGRPFRFRFSMKDSFDNPNFTFMPTFRSDLSHAMENELQATFERLKQKSNPTGPLSLKETIQRLTGFQFNEQ